MKFNLIDISDILVKKSSTSFKAADSLIRQLSYIAAKQTYEFDGDPSEFIKYFIKHYNKNLKKLNYPKR